MIKDGMRYDDTTVTIGEINPVGVNERFLRKERKGTTLISSFLTMIK